MTNRYKILIEYDGTNYYGMQKQNDLPTIQLSIENALYKYCGQNNIYYCGRTDKGVHAIGQVVHFDMPQDRKIFSIISGINFYLYNQPITVISAEKVHENFHSRFDAVKRYYIYKIINRPQKLTFLSKTHLHVAQKLNIDLIKKAIEYLIGQHDFSAFRSSICTSKNPVKTLDSIDITINKDEIHFIVCAKSFLHHMVRNIVGSLLEVGLEKKTPEWIKDVLLSKDRSKAAATAPAHGLYFYKVIY